MTIEADAPVRLPVRHRHGPGRCGGVAFVVLRRFVPGDLPTAADFEWPSGRAQRDGDVLRCDACRAVLFPGAVEEDMREAGAYPDAEYPGTAPGRVFSSYSMPLDTEAQWEQALRDAKRERARREAEGGGDAEA